MGLHAPEERYLVVRIVMMQDGNWIAIIIILYFEHHYEPTVQGCGHKFKTSA